MKRFIITLSLLMTLLSPALVTTGQVAAVDIFPHCGSGSANGNPDVCGEVTNQAANNGSNNPIVKIIKAAIEVLSIIIGAAAIIGIIASAIRMITSGGDPQSAASARTGLIYSLVGVAVTALAQTLVVFVLDRIH